MDKNKGKLITISGPAAADIGTVIKALTTEYENFKIAQITTTRERRESEDSDREYYFVVKEEFEKSIAEDKFIEINLSNMCRMRGIIMEQAKNLFFLHWIAE